MRGFSTVQRIVRTAAVAAIAALLTASCAQHMYLSGTYSGAADAPKFTDDWFAAARAGRTDIVQALIDAHFPLETKTPEGYTALILAAYDNHPDTLKALLAANANACAADRNGNTALMGDGHCEHTARHALSYRSNQQRRGNGPLVCRAVWPAQYDSGARGARRGHQPRRCARRHRTANGARATQHHRSGCTAPGGCNAVKSRTCRPEAPRAAQCPPG
jgi:hypothetical protein